MLAPYMKYKNTAMEQSQSVILTTPVLCLLRQVQMSTVKKSLQSQDFTCFIPYSLRKLVNGELGEFSATSSTVPWGQTQPDRGSLQLDCAILKPCCWPGGSRLEQVRRQERGE